MQTSVCSTSRPTSLGAFNQGRRSTRVRSVVCRAIEEPRVKVEEPQIIVSDSNTRTTDSRGEFRAPDWVPFFVRPPLNFLAAQDFKIQEWWVYKDYLSIIFENEFVVMSTGFRELPEIINGRAAMLGFVICALGEIFAAGTVAEQLSSAPRPVLTLLGLIIAGSLAPVIRGSSTSDVKAIQERFQLSKSVFSEDNERIHGRLAMVGMGALIALELTLGHKIL